MSFSGSPNDPGLPSGAPITKTNLASPYTLINGTGTFFTVPVPNDGQQHLVQAVTTLVVSSVETGGQIQIHTTINGVDSPQNITSGNSAAGTQILGNVGPTLTADPGTNVTIQQATALTAGAAQITKCSVVVI